MSKTCPITSGWTYSPTNGPLFCTRNCNECHCGFWDDAFKKCGILMIVEMLKKK